MFKPYLDVWLDCYLVELKTFLNRESFCQDTTEHVWISIRLCRKWGFSFRLYTPWNVIEAVRSMENSMKEYKKELENLIKRLQKDVHREDKS